MINKSWAFCLSATFVVVICAGFLFSGDTRSSGNTPREPVAGEELVLKIADGMWIVFRWIPGGRATLGSPTTEAVRFPNEAESEEPYETRGYWLCQYLVTQEEYERVVGINPSHFKGNRRPVECVSWSDAKRFLGKLNLGEGGVALREKLGPKAKFVLPSEYQWEYACRGGLGNSRPFYWGDVLSGDKANCKGTSPYGTKTPGVFRNETTEVGSYEDKAKHPWGLCDMSGNVYQWTDNQSPVIDKMQMVRGGCWICDANGCRSAYRVGFDSSSRLNNIGFRIAISVE